MIFRSAIQLGLMLTMISLLNGEIFDFESGNPFQILDEKKAQIVTQNPIAGKASLQIDTRGSSSMWNACARTREGLLRAENDYVATFRCRIDELGPDAYVLILIRPIDAPNERLDAGNLTFSETGPDKKLRIRFKTSSRSSYAFQIHTRGKLLALIDDIEIKEAAGETYLPAHPGAKPYTASLKVPTGSPEFNVELPRPAKTRRSVAEFGASPSLEDNTGSFLKAISNCLSEGVEKLLVPKGVYRFTSDPTIRFTALRDFELDGQGSEFIFLKKSGALFGMEKCERVLFRNFFIDWDWDKDPLGSMIQVTAVDPGGEFLEAVFPDISRFPKRDMRIGILEAVDPSTMTVGYEGSLDLGFEFSKGKGVAKYEWLSDNRFRLFAEDSGRKATFASKIKTGDLFRIRHYIYDMPGIQMSDNTNLTLSNVTIYGTPGHGFVSSGEQHHWQLIATHLIARPGTKHPVTCTADHHHIARSQGFLKMEGCEFSLGGDDCLNVHDTTGFATRTAPNTLTTKNMSISYYREGDPIELRNDDFSPAGSGTYTIKAKVDPGDRTKPAQLVFEETLPEQKTSGFVLFNKRFHSDNVIIRNCYFHDNRARGLLLLAKNITVENNRFFHNQMGAIKIETGYTFNVWSEGYGASNIVIRNNVFDSVNPMGAYPNEKVCAIYMSVYLKSDPSSEKTRFPILNDILVEKNHFLNIPGVFAYVCSAGNVILRDNLIENPRSRIENFSFRGGIGTSYSTQLTVVNNRWIRSPYMTKPGLFADAETTGPLIFEGNQIVEK